MNDTFYEDLAAGTRNKRIFRGDMFRAPYDCYVNVGVIGEAATTVLYSVTIGNRTIARGVNSKTGTTFPSWPSEIQTKNARARAGEEVVVEVTNLDSVNAQMVWASLGFSLEPVVG